MTEQYARRRATQNRAGGRQPRSLRQRLMSGGAWTLANRLLVLVAQFLLLALLGRSLPPEALGGYFFLTNTLTILVVVCQAGLSQGVVRLIPESQEKGELGAVVAAIIQALTVTTMLSTISAVCIIAFQQPLIERFLPNTGTFMIMLITALLLICQTALRICSEVYRGFHDFKNAALFGGIISSVLTLFVVLGWFALSGHLTLRAVLTATLAATVAALALAGISFYRHNDLTVKPDWWSWRYLVGVAWPILVSTGANILLTRADLWIVASFASEQTIGLYGAAARLMVMLGMPFVLASAVLAPSIAQLNVRGEKARLQRMVRTVATAGAYPTLIVILLLIPFGALLLRLIYGNDFFSEGHLILLILGAGQLVSSWAGVASQMLMMTGHQLQVMYITLAVTVVTIVTATLVGADAGVIGVAYCFSGGLILQNVMMAVMAKRVTGVETMAYWNPIAFVRAVRSR